MLKVILAQPRGFCAGVVRAIDIVERALERYEAPVYVRHEIVHNRHVVDKLRRKGAVFVEDLDEVPPGALTIFSAHGVARSVQDEARLRALPTLDATCPLVTKVHVQGRRYARSGRTLILIGHAGHAEVIGTMGQVDAAMHLVSTPADVAALPLADDAPVAYVTQTTLSVDDTRHVIGDEMGVPSYLVDDGDGVDPAWLEGHTAVGITAGASAPDELVDSVIAALRRFRPVTVSQLDGVEKNVEFSLPPELRRPADPIQAAAE